MSTPPLRRIVCDTVPLISLEKITSGYRFIGRLYDRLLAPPAVMDELVAGQFETKGAYLRHFDAEDLVSVEPVSEASSTETVEDQTEHLDDGEREAIRLAIEQKLSLLIEEEAGRAVARELGIQISGIAGQLLKAARERLISAEEGVSKLTELRRAGRINQQLFEAVRAAIDNEA